MKYFFSSQKFTLCLVAITFLCGGLILFCHFLNPEQGPDAMLYISLINKWHLGGFEKIIKEWPGYWLPPSYFYFAHLVMYLGVSAETAGLCVSMLCGMAMPLITFGIAYEITQKKNIALGAALLIAVNPILIELACCVQRDMLYFCYCALSCYFFIAGAKRCKWYFYLLAGAFFILSFFTRLEALELIPLIFLYFLIAFIFKRDKWYFICRNSLLFLAGLFVSGIFFLWATDTSDAMLRIFENYYKGKEKYLKTLYQKKIQQPANITSVKGGKNG